MFPAHMAVNRTKGEYARFDKLAVAVAHVNTAESLNVILKRAWVGVWHWFSLEHMNRYLDQIVFHRNHWKVSTTARLAGLFSAKGKRLRFKEFCA